MRSSDAPDGDRVDFYHALGRHGLLRYCAHPSPLPHSVNAAVPQGDTLSGDAPFEKKIKWYVQPLAFGGSPTASQNVTWITHEQHAQRVGWWNERYLQLKFECAGA